MVYCAVMGCNSTNNKKSKHYSTNYRYFSFPSAQKTCDLWVQKCYRKFDFNVKTARICSRHFSDDDFRDKEKLLRISKDKWKLKENAAPVLNLPNSPEANTSNQSDEQIEKMELGENILDNQEHNDPTLTYNNDEAEGSVVGVMDTIKQENAVSRNKCGITRDIASQTESLREEFELLKKVKDLQEENLYLKKALLKEKAEKNTLEKSFTNGQLRKLKSGREIHWSVDDITSAISLYAEGPSSYQLLKNRGYPLPALSTLRRWAKGRSEEIFLGGELGEDMATLQT